MSPKTSRYHRKLDAAVAEKPSMVQLPTPWFGLTVSVDSGSRSGLSATT
jgi:hypothetical protein